MRKRKFTIFIFKILPKGILSRLFGRLARMYMPKGLLNSIIDWWCNKFEVNREEMVIPEKGFKNLDQFFVRKLKKGVHTIDKGQRSIVSPVDGRVDQSGIITGTRVLQAKGIDYLLSDLIPADIHHAFLDGTFATIYLSPADYHRIHSPVDGNVTGSLHVPGKLFPVKEYVVNGLSGLFTKNERLISYIQTDYGRCAVCKVGAMNVGQISTTYSSLRTNAKWFRRKKETLYTENNQPRVKKGSELGKFHLGSTIVLLFEKDMANLNQIKIGQRVRMGQKIGEILPKKS